MWNRVDWSVRDIYEDPTCTYIFELISCKRGSAEGAGGGVGGGGVGARVSPNFWEGGGGHRWPGLCQISLNGLKSRVREWGTHAPHNFLEGHRFVCAPDLREIQVQKHLFMHWNYIEVIIRFDFLREKNRDLIHTSDLNSVSKLQYLKTAPQNLLRMHHFVNLMQIEKNKSCGSLFIGENQNGIKQL